MASRRKITHITDVLPHKILLLIIDNEVELVEWLRENIGYGAITNEVGRLDWIQHMNPIWVGADRYYNKTWLPGGYFYFKREEDAMAFKLRWS